MKLDLTHQDADEDGQLKCVRASKELVEKKEMSKGEIPSKAEVKMGVKKGGEEGGMDNIVNGFKSCRISEEQSSASDIIGQLTKLTLKDTENDVEPKEIGAGKQEPKEDDERGEDRNEEKERPVTDALENKKLEPLVKLNAPSVEENEEKVLESGILEERGPVHGVPVNSSYGDGHYMAEKSFMPYHNIQTGQQNHVNGEYMKMPANFPDYNNYNHNVVEVGKRRIDDREFYREPQKYVRPQTEGICDMPLMMNNLNAPGNAGHVSGKKQVSSVYKKQMSGGTVYTPGELPNTAEQLMNGMAASNSDYGYSEETLSNYRHSDDGNLLDQLGRQNSIDYPDFWVPENTPNIPAEDFLPDAEQDDMTHMPKNQMAALHQQQQGPLPPVSTLTNPGMKVTGAPQNCQQQYFPQQYENYQQQICESGNRKRGSFGSVCEDIFSEGYGSDLSPPPDMQLSPTPSPLSQMEASPGGSSSSPPRSNWSPPPSNLSNYSVDSGVYSPMSDDQNGYSSQVKSPRQAHMSPPGMTAVPSPYQSPPHSMMSPPHQAMSPSQQRTPQNVEYQSKYIDTHLEDLNTALEIASKDLLEERRKGCGQTGYNVTAHQRPFGTQQNIPNIPGIENGSMTPLKTVAKNMEPMMVSVKPDSNPTSQRAINPGVNGKKLAHVSKTSMSNTIPSVVSIMGPDVSTQSRSKNNSISHVTKALPTGTIVITTAAASPSQPPMNSEGKIAIPPLSKPQQSQGQGQMVPVIVSTNGSVMTPFLIMPNNAPHKTAPRFTPIAPKDPSKTVDSKGKATVNGNSQVSSIGPNKGDPGKGPENGPSNGKKPAGGSMTKLLNLARRLVAEMATEDLRYIDPDRDTYLHVAVCKADRFMVQALLERLVREGLESLIDVQNSMGQTPLYLAVSTNHAAMVHLLVEQGADVNPFAECILPTGAREKSAAIHCAASKGAKYLDTLKALLKARDINLNQVNSDGHTALHCAILVHGKASVDGTQVDSIPIIQSLIYAGADSNLQVQQSGKTALMYALESRDLDLIESIFMLIEPSKLPAFLKTQAFDGSTCVKIAESLKSSLDQAGQVRLTSVLKPGHNRGAFSSSPTLPVS